jgi:hypothetical protein
MYIEEKRESQRQRIYIEKKSVHQCSACQLLRPIFQFAQICPYRAMNDHNDQDDFTYPAIVAWSRTHTLHPAAVLLR